VIRIEFNGFLSLASLSFLIFSLFLKAPFLHATNPKFHDGRERAITPTDNAHEL
jgi:hypothetical protein